ncbi:FecR family protein [Anditalea andensis]|uniref:FecR protein domain-containing protein n=1 Tax=Anditalea andensis TaxID=1048983 RepID=A0A074LNJ6_9BACT|nr:FecR domain-containing protein [Anditalea andensis]KEO75492.1 hypothetical protein EL17_01195 [Anditalea andensis]
MENYKLEKLIDRYLSGTATATEQQLLEDWLDDLASNVAIRPIDIDVKRKLAKKRLMDQIKAKEPGVLFPYAKVAAALVPLLLLTAILWSYFSPTVENITVTTVYGEFQEVWLPDSTKVLLKPNSSLTYPSSFGNERNVQLQGSAFFDVKRDTINPFMVSSENLLVQVLGTSFEVVSYKNMPEQRITVASGRVSVSHLDIEKAILNPSHQLVIDKTTGLSEMSQVSFYKQLNSQRIILHEASLEQMVALLSTYYPIQINHPKETGITLSANLDAKLEVSSILEALNVVLEKYTLSIHQTEKNKYEIQ